MDTGFRETGVGSFGPSSEVRVCVGSLASLQWWQQCIYARPLLETQSPGRSPVSSAWWEGHMVSTEDMQKRAGLVSWLPRPGKEKGFVLWEAWGGGSHSDPWFSSSLPGKSAAHKQWLGEPCLPPLLLEAFPGYPLKALHLPNSGFSWIVI